MRIAYWTTACLEREIEAVSKELFDLARSFPDSRIFAVSPHLSFTVSWRDRYAGIHPRFDPLLRLLIPLIERSARVKHIYAEVGPWLFCNALRRRPIVLTIASEKGEVIPELLERCSVIVTQTEGMGRRLLASGIEASRLRRIYPGVDLSRFLPRFGWIPSRRPKILLATFPRAAEELAGRGLLLLVETAERHREMEFGIVSRPWAGGSTARAALARLIDAHGLTNVTIFDGLQDHMADLYRSHDFTVIPYTSADGGKECPRSLVEGLACGVPVLISEAAPFASFVATHDCGRVFQCSPDGIAAAVEGALAVYAALSANAARVAREAFDVHRTIERYARIYDAFA